MSANPNVVFCITSVPVLSTLLCSVLTYCPGRLSNGRIIMLHFTSVLRAREGSWSAVINQFGAVSRGREGSTGDSVDKNILNDYGLAVPKTA